MNKPIKLHSIPILFPVLIVILSSCSNYPENLKVIPKETNVVSVIDIYSIVKKGNLNEISDFKFYKNLRKEIREDNKKFSRLIDNLFEDPTYSGINLKTELIAFYTDEAEDESFFGLSVELENHENFLEFLVESLEDLNIDFYLDKEKNYYHITIEEESIIGWDNKKAVLLIAENNKSEKYLDYKVDLLMDLTENNQILENENFKNFFQNKEDLSFWLSTNLFENNSEFGKISEQVDLDLYDNYVSTHLNFKDNSISILSEITPSYRNQRILNKEEIYNNSFNKSLLNYFPQKNLALASFSFNPLVFYNILEQSESFEEIKNDFEDDTEIELIDLFNSINGNALFSWFGYEKIRFSYTGLGYGFNENMAKKLDEGYEISYAGYLSAQDKELLDQGETIQAEAFNGRYCINIKNILESGGTIETAISNNSKIIWYEGGWDYGKYRETVKEEYVPLMSMSLDIQNNKNIRKLIEILSKEEIKEQNNYYEFLFDDSFPAYFAFDQDILFITSDKKSINAFLNSGYTSENLGDSKMSSNIVNNNLYSFLDLNLYDYPEGIKKNLDSETEDFFKFWGNLAESIELKVSNKNTFELIINTKNTNSNSLKAIIETMDDNYSYYMNL